METLTPTNYKGSEKTYEDVKHQIAERLGETLAEEFDPRYDARTYRQWLKIGFQVKWSEKGFKSTTMVEKKNERGEIIKKYVKHIVLFHKSQVEPVRHLKI